MKLPSNLSSCCGSELFPTDVLVWKCAECFKVEFCDECGVPEGTIPKLTPEQVAVIRWPSDAQINEMIDATGQRTPLLQFGRWVIRYALQDLTEGDDEK